MLTSEIAQYIHGDDEFSLMALLHDAGEAFIGDIPSPVKMLVVDGVAELRAEAMISVAVAKKFGFTWVAEGSLTLTRYDLIARAYEWDVHVMATPTLNVPDEIRNEAIRLAEQGVLGLRHWSPEDACKAFLARFHVLTDGKFKEDE